MLLLRVSGDTIEARIPCCSNKEVVWRKSGVVRPGKQAGVKRPFTGVGLLVETVVAGDDEFMLVLRFK